MSVVRTASVGDLYDHIIIHAYNNGRLLLFLLPSMDCVFWSVSIFIFIFVSMFCFFFYRFAAGAIMADLDNFFAKKDRKKTKGQKFATSTDNMATSQEELQKKQEKQKKERTLQQSIHSSENDKSSGRKVTKYLYSIYFDLIVSSCQTNIRCHQYPSILFISNWFNITLNILNR